MEILTIAAGMPLYHITPLNIPENYEDEEQLAELPKDVRYKYNRYNGTMFFGLSEFFTMYYDNLWNHAHLEFITNKPLKMLYFPKGYKPLNYRPFSDLLKESGLDGFIAYDDPNDNFLEFVVFKASQNVDFVRELNHVKRKVGTLYPENIDEETLSKYIIDSKITNRFSVEKQGSYNVILVVHPKNPI